MENNNANAGSTLAPGNPNIPRNGSFQKNEEDKEAKAKGLMNSEMQKGSSKLSLANFKLQELNFLGGQIWDSLLEIDLHKNYLSSIDILNQFRNLKTIRASDNYLQEVTLNLQKLEKLDLHNNYINKFPLLHQLPKITELNLNANKIQDFRIDFKPPSCLSLQILDLGCNQIQFNSNYEFNDFLEKLKKLKNLKELIVSNNPNFTDEKKFDQIVSTVQSLEKFNNERAEEYRKQVMEEEKKLKEPARGEGKKGTQGRAKIDKLTFYFPSLSLLNHNLEAANIHPSNALQHLKDLAQDVDKIGEHLEMIDEYFVKGKNEVEIQEMIETFMQNSQLLIDNHYELQNIMLSILAKLSIVRFYNFGVRCFNTLKDLMIAGKQMEKRVIEILKKEVINKLEQQSSENMPVSFNIQLSQLAQLIQGLYELVEETGKSEMLVGLFENFFPSRLRALADKISACKRIAIIYENNPLYDQIIALLSVAVKDNKVNVKKAIDKELLPCIADILNESKFESDRYIFCLRIVEYICIQHEGAADVFIDKVVQSNLMKNIRNAIHIYKKFNDLKDENSKDTEEKIKKKYLTLAAEIDCLGGLLEADKSKRDPIIKDPLLDELLQITSHYKTDPVLLTAICKFARQLFSRDEIKCNQHLLEPKIKKMQNLVQLTPYLGLKKYDELLKMSRRYYSAHAYADKEKATQLQHLDDVVVHNLFIAIVQLINFFCEESEKDGSSPIFDEVSQSLNDANREIGLFNCLEVPNDEVKLAVVECLNNVPLSEFDTEEIATIIKLVGSYKNIGAGKTEFVLAKIFWILTKMTKEKVHKSGKDFRFKFGEKAISEALDILIRNLSREIDDEDEEMEKLALSLSCLHFLKFTSENADLKRYLLNRHDQFKQALYAEENFTSPSMTKYPIEIEETWLGRNMDVLVEAMKGNDSIDPYNYVSFRLLQRMADLLMNRLESELLDPFKPNVDIIETLMIHYKEKLKQRKKTERSFWEDPPEDFISQLSKDPTELQNFQNQHQYFTSNNGIQLMKMFLTKKVPAFELWLKKEYNPQYSKSKLKKTLIQFNNKCVEKELEKSRIEEAKKGKPIVKEGGDDEESEAKFGDISMLRMVLQQEEIGANYDPSKTQDHLVQEQKSSQTNVENIKKRDFKVGVQNFKMRSLCIAAYLRCLFAAIEYAPRIELKYEAIRILKDQFFFKNLTELCDTTGWFEANIGAKYLRIMRHVIKMESSEANENMENLPLYEIMSIVVNKILNQVMIKIKNEQQKALTNEDKILIFELAATCSLLCSQCQLFQWTTQQIQQSGPHTKARRTPQEKTIDHQISQLFPAQSLQTFIAIIFRDMNIAYKIFDADQGHEEREPYFIKQKNDLTREQIKFFLGEYLSKCKEHKYDILESIMKGVVFEKKLLRDSFLQEILKSLQKASYRMAIQEYVFNKRMGFDSEELERIVNCDWVDISINGQTAFKPRLIVLTNKGIHFLRIPASKPCSVCPPESLCPDGPRAEQKYKYERLVEIITFPNVPQKFVLKISLTSLLKKGACTEISVIVPQTIIALQMIEFLKEAQINKHSSEDMLFFGSITNQIGAQEELRIAKYISYNPTKSLFGFGEEPIISNCILAVLSNTELYLLKENWNKWYYDEDYDNMITVIEKGTALDETASIQQKQDEAKLKQSFSGIFSVTFKKGLKDIKNLHVHKGKDPIVELQFGARVEKLIFLSDYCRQQFIETLLDVKMGRSSGKAKKETKKNVEEDDEEY